MKRLKGRRERVNEEKEKKVERGKKNHWKKFGEGNGEVEMFFLKENSFENMDENTFLIINL